MPEYEVKVNIPERPKGDPIDVPGVGQVENGTTTKGVEMSTEDAERFRGAHGIEIKQTSARKTDADRAAEQEADATDITQAEEGGE